jgi:GDP-4-dehydro-6-deoxy-D-mannose reductase
VDPQSSPCRILITGAGGFVGSWLIAALRPAIPAGGELLGLGLRPSSAADRSFAADIGSREEVQDVISQVRPTCVVHLAAIATIQEAAADVHRTWAVNLGGTLNLVSAVMRHAPDARFILASTSEVYGGAFADHAIDELARLAPMNTYAATKAASDLLVGQAVRDGLRAVRFRPFNHTGPGQTEHFVIPAFAAQVARIEHGLQEPRIRVGNLDARRDFLDVRDVVAAYATAALMDDDALTPGTILNLASGTPRRIGDILEMLLSRARTAITVDTDPARLRPNDIPVAFGDAACARAALGWEPRVPFETTLADVLDDWRHRVYSEAGGGSSA